MTETHWGRKETIVWPPHTPIYSYGAVFLALIATGVFLYARFAFALSPLEQYYLPVYLKASITPSFRASAKYQMLLVSDGRGHAWYATDKDVVSGSTSQPGGMHLPLALSASAKRNGMIYLYRSVPALYPNSSLRNYLQQKVYGGAGLVDIFEWPLLFGLLALFGQLPFSIPKDIRRRKEMKYGRRLKGPILVTPKEFNKAFQGTGIGFKTDGCREMLRIPVRAEDQHFEIIGDTGSGKTTIIMQMLRQIQARGHSAILYDPACEFIERFYDEKRGDIVLNPLDRRCPYWGPSEELVRRAEARTIAASLFQPTSDKKGEFFIESPQKIFAHLLLELPTPQQLIEWMSHPEEIDRRVKGTELASLIEPSAPQQRSGVLGSLSLVADSFRLLPRKADAKTEWTAREWSEKRQGWIFITSQPAEREALRPLHSLWIDMLVLRLLSAPKPEQHPVWFVLDELASLQKLPQLHTAITENRKSRNPIVLGFQGKAQLEVMYGHLAEVMLSQPATKIFLKTGEPDAAEWVIRSRHCLNAFDFRKLFIEELGWDKFSIKLVKQIDGAEYRFQTVAEKRGVVVLVCNSIPEYAIRVKLDRLIAKDHFEHLIVFADQAHGRQVWQWVRKESGKPTAVRTYRYDPSGHAGELLLQKLDNLVFTLEEEEEIRTGTVTGRMRTFDVEKVTKKFYERFKTEHDHFLKFIKGIPDTQMESWYASVMINRLMFLYFIQEKGFLNGDKDYLRNKLAQSRDRKPDAYYSEFLSPLFFQGFARKKADRSAATNKLLGEIPYLNGGLFQKHQIEELHGKTIHIADTAFEKLFDFFKEYNWHLDERENRNDREINPDVLGYIFEKYINQKQMGAYYTKEDITEYIAQNTIIPFLLDEARKGCAIAFAPDGSVWNLLREHPDRYIHDAMKKGACLPLPPDIEAGIGDVAKRTGWNRTAPEDFALPTEIWREAIDRHQRYRAVKEKLANGEVHQVNDLVTLNLNIRQFAQDAIQFSEGPELLRAIWKAIERVSILDPTCGSGAFLFAALNILKPLYEACLIRMQGFIEDMEAAGTHRATKFEDFKRILAESERHPKQDYFILKAIIVSNLFGVDIMEEAVEICKLRLFLKLVAQVESQDRIEPLPDIDFNIRSGNTLVGYARYADVEKAVKSKLDFGDAMSRIEDKARVLDSSVELFRKQQTQLDGTVTAEDKAELRCRFAELEAELNDHLSGEYGIKKTGLKKWRGSHKPFHWFCDFHRIITSGGFDVIIGNPPWKEYAAVKEQYRLYGYATESCGNLHGMTTERAISLAREGGRISFIVQLPLTSSSRMNTVRSLLRASSSYVSVIPFDDRPGKLFDGLQHCRSAIFTSRKGSDEPKCEVTSQYQRWPSEARQTLFLLLGFSLSNVEDAATRQFAKLGSSRARGVIGKLQQATNVALGLSLSSQRTRHFIFYQEATQYWIKATVGLPFYSKNGQTGAPAHGRYLSFHHSDVAHAANAILNSSIFYLYFIVFGDCFHLSDTLVSNFPTPPAALIDRRLIALNRELLEDLNRNAATKTITTKDKDVISYAEFSTGPSKPIIDQIDRALAEHYGFTDDELEFIINYDIKFRLNADADEDEE